MEKGIRQKLKWQLILFLARRLPPCNVLLPLFSEELERPLNVREKITKKLHLFSCEACHRYIAQIKRMSEIVKPQNETGTETDTEPPAKLSEDARRRIRIVLEAAGHSKKK